MLDGWDCTLDKNGRENGGITWGPAYTSKHACSNSPMVSPLVWLAESHKALPTYKTFRVLDADGRLVLKTLRAYEYYLVFAKKIYAWQKRVLYDAQRGACWDAIWAADDKVTYRTVDGVRYREHIDGKNVGGTFFTYNIGTMISSAADLYRATQDATYKSDLRAMVTGSFSFFAPSVVFEGRCYRMFPSVEGFKHNNGAAGTPWFNDVLLRGYIDAYIIIDEAKAPVQAMQTALDYGYRHHLKAGILPVDLFAGWQQNNRMNAMYASPERRITTCWCSTVSEQRQKRIERQVGKSKFCNSKRFKPTRIGLD